MGPAASDEKMLSELVDRALSGDEVARQKLFSQLRSLAKQMAKRRMGRRTIQGADDSDIAQDSLAELAGKVESLPRDCDPKLKAYVATTVLNTIRKRARSAVTRKRTNRTYQEAGIDVFPSPSKSFRLKEGYNQARVTAVLELTPEQREALMLILGEQLTTADCAARMQRSEKSIAHLIDRAMSAITSRLNGEDSTIPAGRREPLRRVLLKYLKVTSGGRSIAREEFLRQHPKYADALAPLLTELEHVRRIIRGPAD